MCSVRSISSPVVAIFLADIHLSMKAPLARMEEPSWFAAMDRSLAELRDLQRKHQCPVLCAGDVFDRWNSPPELINWAIERLPLLYGIPGNHDLPGHRPELAYRSAYGTLVRAGKITELGGWPVLTPRLAIYGRPFGEEIPERREQIDPERGDLLHVLVTHEYLWVKGTGHQGASKDTNLSKIGRGFREFDLVISGDNHIPFERTLKNGTKIVNCGSFFRRKVTEQLHRPRIGLLHASGRVSFHLLSLEGERISAEAALGRTEVDESFEEGEMESFVSSLGTLKSSSLDFRDNLERAMEGQKVREEVKQILLEAMES